MNNPYDQFDSGTATANPYDQFDVQPTAQKSFVDKLFDLAKTPSPQWLQPAEKFLKTPLVSSEAIGSLLQPVIPASVAADPIAQGIGQGASEAASQFTSPAMLATAPFISAEGLAGKAVAGAFTAQGLAQYPALYRQYQATDDPKEKARILATAAVLAAPAAGLLPRGRSVPELKTDQPSSTQTQFPSTDVPSIPQPNVPDEGYARFQPSQSIAEAQGRTQPLAEAGQVAAPTPLVQKIEELQTGLAPQATEQPVTETNPPLSDIEAAKYQPPQPEPTQTVAGTQGKPIETRYNLVEVDHPSGTRSYSTMPETPEGFTRLFRWEPLDPTHPGLQRYSEGIPSLPEHQGGWWYQDIKNARMLGGGAPGGYKIISRDVPNSELEQYRVSNQPDIAKHSYIPEEEFFIPKDAKGGETNATQKGNIAESSQPEYTGNAPGGTPTETGSRGGTQPETPVQQKGTVTSTAQPPPLPTQQVGVAERYVEAEQPGTVISGTRENADYWRQQGRDYINQGGDPRMPIRAANAGHVSPRNVGIVSAEHERLTQIKRQAGDALQSNPNNPELQRNFQAASDAWQSWRREMQPVLTRAGESLGAAIGEQPVDLGTFDGLHTRAMELNGGQELTPVQKMGLVKRARIVEKARAAERQSVDRLQREIDRTLPPRKIPTREEMAAIIEQKVRKLTPCR